jgi:(E)-4-hydroxy-3-methylbut-2-enyl-diphosphate synthase
VTIGDLPVGGSYPVRIQSMTNTNTMDTEATVNQAIQLIEAGCEMVRITAPGKKEARNLEKIKNVLCKRGYDVPIIADIHFNPRAAEVAAKIVEKVRINPGNYVDQRKFQKIRYTEQEYQEEINRISERLYPLIRICKDNGTAIRVGTNHGSLSDRIMNRYGDTPLGMVESALEYARIFRQFDFFDLVLSMKSSNVKIMVYATRLLVKKMLEEGMNCPLHLGVTEAGDGMDGKVKSAAGTGTLLADGIGDTIRVSLTGDPVDEIPVAKMLARQFNYLREDINASGSKTEYDPIVEYSKRITNPLHNIGGHHVPVVVMNKYPSGNGQDPDLISPDGKVLVNKNGLLLKLSEMSNILLVLESDENNAIPRLEQAFRKLDSVRAKLPVFIKINFKGLTREEILIRGTSIFSYLLINGYGDGIWIDTEEEKDMAFVRDLSFAVLQALGLRITRTEYIACPSCGRTLFNIQEALSGIKEKTQHLKGLKIAVMGCIVNGPGEMADADYGYVGAGKGKITLYKGKEVMKKNINEKQAVDELVDLIKAHGDWRPGG